MQITERVLRAGEVVVGDFIEFKGNAVGFFIASICTSLEISDHKSDVVVILCPAASAARIAGVSSGGIELGAPWELSLNSFDRARQSRRGVGAALKIEEHLLSTSPPGHGHDSLRQVMGTKCLLRRLHPGSTGPRALC